MTVPLGTFPILSFEQNNPLLTGTQRGLGMGYDARGAENDLRTKAFQRALLEKYGEQEAQQGIEKNMLANELAKINLQYAPQTAETELAYKQGQIPLMGEQANMLRFKREHPLWGAGGLAGQIGAAEFGGQLPNGQSNQDLLQQHILNSLEKEKNLTSLYGKRSAGFEFKELPKDRKDEILGKFETANIPFEIANRRLLAGETVEDIANDYGIAPEEFDAIPATFSPTTPIKTRTQNMMMASAEHKPLAEVMLKGFGAYPESIHGYSPSQLFDQMMGLNDEKQQYFYAAVALSADDALIRARRAGLTPGVTAMQELTESANIKKDYLRARMKPENYIKGQQIVDRTLTKMNEAAQKAALNPRTPYEKPNSPNSEYSKVANGDMTPEIISQIAREQNKSEEQTREDFGLENKLYSSKLKKWITEEGIKSTVKASGKSEEEVRLLLGVK